MRSTAGAAALAVGFLLDESALLAILSGISWGASAIVAKRMYRRYPRLDLLSLTAWQMLYAALVMSVVAWLVPQRSIDWQPGVFWALAYSAILATAVAWSLWLYVLRNLPASVAGLSTLAVPVCGVLFPGGCWVKSGASGRRWYCADRRGAGDNQP